MEKTTVMSTRRRVRTLALALAVPALTAGLGLLGAGSASASPAYTPVKNAGQAQLCLDVRSEDGLQNNGARLQLYHCTGVSEQQFLMIPEFSGQNGVTGLYQLEPKSGPGRCLVPAGYSAFTGAAVPNGIGAQVVQEPCNASNLGQEWNFRSDGAIVNDNSLLCLDTTGSGTRDHESVMTFSCNNGTTQHWFH